VFGSTVRRRWILALAFGLVHGFGFSFGLQQQLQFAGSHLAASLIAFNVGVELGQLAVLAVLVPALALLLRGRTERAWTILLSVFVGHTAWHWMLERYEKLSRFPWPTLDPGAMASAIRWLIALLIVAAIAWAVAARLRKKTALGSEPR
jgi:hypothetical protein